MTTDATRSFVAETLDRRHIHAFVMEAAAALPAGARVLDAGAGDAPYAGLFAHCDYRRATGRTRPTRAGERPT